MAKDISGDRSSDVDRARSFDPERGSFEPPRRPSLRDPQTNPRGVRHIDETAQDLMAVGERPRYRAAQSRRARMIAAASAAARRLRRLPGGQTELSPSDSPDYEAEPGSEA